MDRGDKMIIEDVKKILSSGNDGIINTLKLNVKAYLACIDIENRKTQEIDDLNRRLGFLEVETQKKGYDIQALRL